MRAARRVLASASRSSGTMPAKWGSPPASRTRAASAGAVASRTWPVGRSGVPGGTSSSPVETMATCGRACTGISVSPAAASMPRSWARSGRPAGTSSAPGAASSSARTIPSPGVAGRRTSSSSAVAAWVCSTFTTASAPGGSGAPVAIATAVPGRTSTSGGAPMRDLAGHVEVAREPLRCAVGVGGAHGEAVDGRAREAGQRVRRAQRLGGHAAERLVEWHRLDGGAARRAGSRSGPRRPSGR